MIRALALILIPLLLLLPPHAAAQQAESIVAGLSQTSVSITTDFSGSEILIYGAVKRESAIPDGPPLEVIVTVEGPATPVTVRRKERVAGIWINRAAVRVDRAPSFYAIATTGPLAEVLSETENLRHQITIPRAIRSIGISAEAEGAPLFLDALQRIREGEGRYHLDEGQVELAEATLFRADVALPSNLTEGDYRVRIFLTRGGNVVDILERSIGVEKAGLERMLFNLAQQRPLVYGLISLMIAVLAGWGASAVFRLIRL